MQPTTDASMFLSVYAERDADAAFVSRRPKACMLVTAMFRSKRSISNIYHYNIRGTGATKYHVL